MKRLMVAATVLMSLAGWSGIALADNSSDSTNIPSSLNATGTSASPATDNGALGKPGDASAKDKGTSGSSMPSDEGGTAGNLHSGARGGGGAASGAGGGAAGGAGGGAGGGGGGR